MRESERGIGGRLAAVAPGAAAGAAFGGADAMMAPVMHEGLDPATLMTMTAILSLAAISVWLLIVPARQRHTPGQAVIALALGVPVAAIPFLFAGAFFVLPAPLIIVAFFAYPLPTALLAALCRMDRLSGRGLLASLAALTGLLLLSGLIEPDRDQGGPLYLLAGLAFALPAVLCRMLVLLVGGARIAGTDPRLTVWFALLTATPLCLLALWQAGGWSYPDSHLGWVALAVFSFAAPLAILMMFISINRIGPIRTALLLNLEALLALPLAMGLEGMMVTVRQEVGAAIMLAALCAVPFCRPA